MVWWGLDVSYVVRIEVGVAYGVVGTGGIEVGGS